MSLKGRISYSTRQGLRYDQEDRLFYRKTRSIKFGGWVMAVMDGHGGARAAEVCSAIIGPLFTELCRRKNSASPEDFLRSLVSILADKTSGFEEGSTLSIALVLNGEDKVVVAVLGDSPVIVVDQSNAIHISPEHNVRTNLRDRDAAIENGAEYENGYIYNKSGHGLQLSRALGDGDMSGILSRQPEIYVINKPKWVVVGSDGLLDPEHGDAAGLAQQLVRLLKPKSTADQIMDWASHRGLKDNATVVLWERKD